MSGTTVHAWLLTRLVLPAVVLSLLVASPALALDFTKGDLTGTWDTTISWGAQYRLEDPDLRIIGLPSGGSAFSVNGDDGNLNYDKGIVSNVFKLTTELELNYKNVGAFVRGRGFYDYENEDGDRLRTPLSNDALKRVGSRADLLDAFVWSRFDLGGMPTEIRIGEQVVSWGESTFIQGGINTINPVDVSAIRVPGAELREALLPEGMVAASIGTVDQHHAGARLPVRLGTTRDRPSGLLLQHQRLRRRRRDDRLPRASATPPMTGPSRFTDRPFPGRARETEMCAPTTAGSTARRSACSRRA